MKGDRTGGLTKGDAREDEVDTTVASSLRFCRRDVEERTCKLKLRSSPSFLESTLRVARQVPKSQYSAKGRGIS
jgi:hypothetical protein